MTAYDVDLGELRAAVAELASCHRDLLRLAAEVDREQGRLRTAWLGDTADAEESSYATWRDGCADMVSALADLRATASLADEHYSRAVDNNLARWHLVGA
jgi:WXG100 family type VII secretion target